MKANAVAAVVFLLVGGLYGLMVGLTRWQAVHLLAADDFYMALTAHGINVLIFWIIFFEIAVLYFCSSVLLKCRLATPRWAWVGFVLMLIGAVMNNVIVLQGNSSVMMTSYVPMEAHPLFYLSLILFAVGALIGTFVFFGTLVVAKAEKTYEGSVPLVTFGAITAAVIAVFTIVSGAIVLLPTFLWSIGLVGEINVLAYRMIWWAFGHSSQQINVAAHVSVWYAIAAIVFGARPLSEKVSRTAFLMYILFLQLERASPARRPGAQLQLQDVQHKLCDVSGRNGVHGARTHSAGFHRSSTAGKGAYRRPLYLVAQSTLGQSGLFRHVHFTDWLWLYWRHIRCCDGY